VEVSLDNDALTVNSALTPCEPSHWAFGQFSTMLKAPAHYLRELPKPLLVDCLNHGIKNAPRDSVKFMTIASESDQLATLQAVTSPTYGRIWDADCVDAVGRIVEKSGGRFYNPKAYTKDGIKPQGLYASDRDVFMFMIDGGSRLDVGPRAQLNRGFFVWNSEVGAKTFGLTTFLFNECCGNHILWGATDINTLAIRHTKNGPARFDKEALPVLLDYVNASAATEESVIRKAQDFLLPLNDKSELDLDKMLTPFKFTSSERKSAIAFAKSEEGECRTLWDLVQGFTAYARGFDYLDSRTDLEKRAGSLLKLVS
jgi:hypothetical protein